MKKLTLVCAALIAALALLPRTPASAGNAEYLRALSDDAGFYSAADENSLLFYLPRTYYVKVIRSEGSFSYCQYEDAEGYYLPLYGYVKTDSLTPAENTPVNPYPKLSLDVKTSDVIYASRALSGDSLCFALAGSSVRYYGKATSPYGELLYFVTLGDQCGYVKATSLSVLDLPAHPDPLPKEPDPLPPEGGESEGGETAAPAPKSSEGLKIAMIVALGVICLIVVYLLFRPAKKKPDSLPPVYDESDYE